MKIEELKKLLKPLIKTCIKEILLEEKGILSHVIQECVQATQGKVLVERIQANPQEQRKNILRDITTESHQQQRLQQKQSQISDNKKMLVESLAKSGYDNLKGIFEGIAPISTKGNVEGVQAPQGPLANVDPNDEGVPLDIFGLGNSKFKI